VLIRTLLSEARVERFNQRVVRWFSRSAEIELYFVPVCPPIQILGDELGSIVHLDALGKTMFSRDALQRCHHIDATDPSVRLEDKTLAGVVLDNH
jgi:hypothetical protein